MFRRLQAVLEQMTLYDCGLEYSAVQGNVKGLAWKTVLVPQRFASQADIRGSMKSYQSRRTRGRFDHRLLQGSLKHLT